MTTDTSPSLIVTLIDAERDFYTADCSTMVAFMEENRKRYVLGYKVIVEGTQTVVVEKEAPNGMYTEKAYIPTTVNRGGTIAAYEVKYEGTEPRAIHLTLAHSAAPLILTWWSEADSFSIS